MTNRKLSPQEAAFCRAYVLECSRDAKAAAIKAGYSENGAAVQGHRLLQRPHVRIEIARLEGEALKRSGTISSLLTDANRAANPEEPAAPGSIAEELRNETDANMIAVLGRAYVLAAVRENLDICLGRRKRRMMRTVTQIVEEDGKKVKRKVEVEVEIYDPNPSAANAAAVILLNAPEISQKAAGNSQNATEAADQAMREAKELSFDEDKDP